MATESDIRSFYEGTQPIEFEGTKYFLAEGDLLLTQKDLERYAHRRAQDEEDSGSVIKGEPLKAMVDESGRLIRWQPGLVLTYGVLKSTLTPPDRHNLVVNCMEQATSAWEAVCGIRFQHLPAYGNGTPAGMPPPLFWVRGFNAGGRFIAAAFFPDWPAERRVVVIDPSFFSPTLSFDRVGVLRHELGHVLGFRHEHIDSGAPPECPGEDPFRVVDLTQYDPKSVMHYFCGGVGSKTLELTDKDKAGAVDLYGRSLSKYRFFPE